MSNSKPNKLPEDLDLNNCGKVLTVGELLNYIEESNLSPESPVLIQRVEDVYFSQYGWKVHYKADDTTLINEDGSFHKPTMEQYIPAMTCCDYFDEENVLFINLHF